MTGSQIAGAIYGAAVGDAIGATYEGLKSDSSRTAKMAGGGQFSLNVGDVTDDTYMMLTLFETWQETGYFSMDAFLSRAIQTIHAHPQTFGKTTGTLSRLVDMGCDPIQSVRIIDNIFGSRTNGSVMRTLPVGLVATSLEEAKELARKVSQFTHLSKEAGDACSEVSGAVYNLLHGESKETVFNSLSPIFREGDLIPSVDAIESTRCAFLLFHTSQSYEELMNAACRLGGDSDTIAAIAGGMWGVTYGLESIPKEWVSSLNVQKRIEKLILDLAGNGQISGMSNTC